MKRITNQICAFAAAAGMLFAAGCDKTYVNEVVKQSPVIESFSPASGPVGTEIIITGQSLSGVTKAYIGDQEMVIKEKVSDSRLSIVAGANGRDGRIVLENSVGTSESEASFTYSYAVPSLKPALLQESVVMGDRLLLSGSNLTAVEAVLYTAEGCEESHEGEIYEQSASEIVVRVPYVENGNVRITLRYFDGEASVTTLLDEAPSIEVVRLVPKFDKPIVLERTAVGKSITLTGENLDKIDRILVGGFEAVVSKQPASLTFTVPAGNFQDGDTTTSLVAKYFDGNEEIVLSEAFVVYVPFVKFWENITVWGHDKEAEQYACNFSPETGRVYANSVWATELDPIAAKYTANTCSAALTPNVTEEEYNSVVPYFFFYCNGSGNVNITAPANSAGILKNFWYKDSEGELVRMVGVNGNCYGTPVLAFRALNPANATESALIEKVKNQTLEQIDEETFPIDVEAQTVGGIGVSSSSGGLKDSNWSNGCFTPNVEAPDVNPDAVILVLYYDYQGVEKGGDGKNNFARNVKRIGLMHITHINYRMLKSDYTFNIYWQKYDYDYSKLAN